jgi:hypothetical protein
MMTGENSTSMKTKILSALLLALIILCIHPKGAFAISDPVPTNEDFLGASPIALSTYCPTTGNTSITTCNDHIYDSGGPSGAYGANQDGYVVVYPSTTGAKVQLTGTYYTEANYDYIYIYNGVGTGGTLLYTGSASASTSIGTIVSTSADGALTVRLKSDGSVQNSGFDFTISCVMPPAPSNDNCANAIAIGSLPYTSAIISNVSATDDVPTTTCDGPYKNIWWTVTGICGTMTANTCTGNTNFDSELAVFTGSCGSMTQVGCNDDGCSLQSTVTWNSTAGTIYYISVGSYYASGATGNIQLNVTGTPLTSSTDPTSITGTTTICNGNSTTLTANGGTDGAGATMQWFSGSCGGTSAGSGSSITVAPTASTTYYVRRSGTCNTTGCASTTVTVDPIPTAASSISVSATSLCSGSTLTVTRNGAITGTDHWWMNRDGVNWDEFGDLYAGSSSWTRTMNCPGSNASYTYQIYHHPYSGACDWHGWDHGSWSPVVTVYNPTIAGSVVGSTTICQGSMTGTLILTGQRGSVVKWQKRLNGGAWTDIANTATTYIESPSSAGTWEYVAVVQNGPCSALQSAAATVIVNSQSTPPTSITGTTSICFGASTTLTAVGGSLGTGATAVWYEGSACGPFTQDWITQPYGASNTTVNSVIAGVLNVTSTTNDPMIDMSGLGSFNPSTYKYINIKYRVLSGTAGYAEIFFYNGAHNYAVGGDEVSGTLISDGAWHVLTINMSTDPDYVAGGTIYGWRFDWAAAAGVNMEIDYISLSQLPVGSATVSPTSTTQYFVRYEGQCNTTSCASTTVTVNTPSTTTPSPISAGDYVWSGVISNSWVVPGNWMVYNGSGNFSTATAAPDSSKNVFLRDYGSCVTNPANILNGPAGYCRNITIESSLTMDVSTLLYVSRNWTNNGTFNRGTSTIVFNGGVGISTITTGGMGAGKQFYGVIVNSNGTSNIVNLAGSIQIWGGFLLTSALQFNCNSYDMLLVRDFTHMSGQFNRGTGTVTLQGAGAINGPAPTIFRNLVVNGTYTINAPYISMMKTSGVGGDLTIGSGGNFTAGANNIYLEGNWTNQNIFNAGTGHVNFVGNSTQEIKAGASAFYKVIFNNSGAGSSDFNISQPMSIQDSGTFLNGVAYYTGSGALNYLNGAVSNGGTAGSFVNGSVAKTGSNAFIFPVGKVSGASEIWAPLEISAPGNATDKFSAEYFFTSAPNNWDPADMCNLSQLDHVSGVEYWNLVRMIGSATPTVKLYWKDAQRSGITNVSDLVVAHYEHCPTISDPNRWKPMATVASGTTGAGGTGTALGSGFTNYSPVTFGTRVNSNPLPVSLLAFTAECKEGNVILNWSTASESNNDYFTLERSSDASNWEMLSVVDGAGNSNTVRNYATIDTHPLDAMNYYRLSQTDFDGQLSRLKIVSMACEEAQGAVAYFPNPFSSTLQIEIQNVAAGQAVLKISDLTGRCLISKTLICSGAARETYQLDLSNLPKGMYVVEFKTDSYTNIAKIIKE